MCDNQNSGGRRRRRRRAGWVAAPALAAAAIAVPAQATELDRKALADALDDEYRAEASYQAVIDKFGPVRPFINIIEAEKRHSSMVRGQYARLGMSAPENPYLGKLKPPASLLEACEQGVEAEIENIALYDRLLPMITDPAVRQGGAVEALGTGLAMGISWRDMAVQNLPSGQPTMTLTGWAEPIAAGVLSPEMMSALADLG